MKNKIIILCLLVFSNVFLFSESFPKMSQEFWENTNTIELRSLLNDVDINIRDDAGKTILMWASAWVNNTEILNVLLEVGARLDARDIDGKTALLLASEKNINSNIIIKLLEYEDKKTDLSKCLTYMIDRDELQVINILLDKVADMNEALIFAIRSSKYDLVKLLVERGVGLNPRSRFRGNISYLTIPIKNNDIEMLKLLLKLGSMPNAFEGEGGTALAYAAGQSDNEEIILTLIEYGALNVEDSVHKTPWDIIQNNKPLFKTEAYWAINELRF